MHRALQGERQSRLAQGREKRSRSPEEGQVISKAMTKDASVIWQEADCDTELPHLPLFVLLDSAGNLCVEQEGNVICLNFASIPELFSVLKSLTPAKNKK
jgi:hypothetical protein